MMLLMTPNYVISGTNEYLIALKDIKTIFEVFTNSRIFLAIENLQGLVDKF